MNKITESQEVKKEKQYNYRKNFCAAILCGKDLLKCSSSVDFTQERNYIFSHSIYMVIVYVNS